MIDLGPEGGGGGGRVVAEGTPEAGRRRAEQSTPGQALQRVLEPRPATRQRQGEEASGKEAARSRRRRGWRRSPSAGRGSTTSRASTSTSRAHKMTVCCGPSGSGKSSLAIDTLYAEGQRRYVESLSAYARQFLAPLQKPKVERISGLSPAISIEQKTTSKSPRSTVGTVTEIHDYLRILFARLGQPLLPELRHRRSARRRPTRSSRRSSTCPRGRRST